MPSDCAAAFVCSTVAAILGFTGFDKTATRASPGTISVRSWSRLPASSAVWRLGPVTLPPGRWRLATKPFPTGSGARRHDDWDGLGKRFHGAGCRRAFGHDDIQM